MDTNLSCYTKINPYIIQNTYTSSANRTSRAQTFLQFFIINLENKSHSQRILAKTQPYLNHKVAETLTNYSSCYIGFLIKFLFFSLKCTSQNTNLNSFGTQHFPMTPFDGQQRHSKLLFGPIKNRRRQKKECRIFE